MSKRNRKRNPYRLTPDEKIAVVDLYARFQTSEEVIDTVMTWKPEAATGDTTKDRKNVTDAIRTCNPNSRVFSFHVALQARRAEYLSERSGTFVAAISEFLSKLTAAMPDIEFDFKTVSAKELPKLVSALNTLFTLMRLIDMNPYAEVARARTFNRKLDEYPQRSVDDPTQTLTNTRREMLADAEAFETIHAEQIEDGTARSAEEIMAKAYPQNYVFPDFIVQEVWEELTGNYDIPKKPSPSQMLKEISEHTKPNGQLIDKDYQGEYWWELVNNFEARLADYRQYLSSDWGSQSPSEQQRWQQIIEKAYMEAALSEAKSLGIDLEAMGTRKHVLTELWNEIKAEKQRRARNKT